MSAPVTTSRAVVLVVDDESLIRWSLRERLSGSYEVLEAETGLEALAVFGSNPVDLVLLDLCLPELDGLGVLERIRATHPACPVIVMTAYGSPESAEKAAALGATAFLTKPFDLDRMIGLVKEKLRPSAGDPAPPV